MHNQRNILLITSNTGFGKNFKLFLGSIENGHKLIVVYNSLLALDEIKKATIDCVIVEAWIHKMSTEKLIQEIQMINSTLPTIVIDNGGLENGKFEIKENSDNLICISSEFDKPESENIFFVKILIEINFMLKKNESHRIKSSRKALIDRHSFGVLAIGASTGGPVALEQVLKKIPKDFPLPIVVTLHMPPVFTKNLADRLNSICSIPVKEAEERDVLKPGCCYIAPGNFHMCFTKKNNEVFIFLNQNEWVNSCRPSVDVMLESLEEIYQGKIMVVILTGMGSDGANACKIIKEEGGHVVIQNQESSVVWGMPKAVFDLHITDKILPIHEIGDYVSHKIQGFRF